MFGLARLLDHGILSGMKLEIPDRDIQFRSISPADRPILLEIYASSRQNEMDLLQDWTAQQKLDFLTQQFDAQHTHYQQHNSAGFFQLILKDLRPIGRLYWIQYSGEIRIIDIALLPDFQSQGIGTTLLASIQKLAADNDKKVSIHVEFFNPALRLYERLGFQKVEEHGIYHFMIWNAEVK